MQVPQALSSLGFFSGLPPAELQSLGSAAVVKQFAAGDFLFFEGEDCKGMWIIAAGAVKIVKATPSGRQVMLAMQSAPSAVAEVAVFDGGPYPATVTAMEPVTALLILKEDFLACCRRNPSIPLRVLAGFGARLRHLVNLVERITFGSIRQRLAHEILNFSAAAGSNPFLLPETHEELASRLGTVREVVSRNLGRFQAEGMIRLLRREVEILNREALEAESNTEL
ncbi:MAG: Crp/Fnr family transcriptional regulator [Acidobacteria bacterium]|nr:Crp/Fnr family transcriptional regulator [Acidobacteriota bacterium]